LRDQASFGVLAIGCAFIIIALHPIMSALTGLGYALLLVWALYGMWGLHRFGSALLIPADATASNCAVVHLRQLQRQRDIVLSWPLGIGLAIPAVVLVAIGQVLGPKPIPWAFSVALIGVFVFVYLAVLIYGRVLAGRWQAEIDELVALTRQEG
jgi:uncharacterized membrane protein YfcA